MKKLFTVLAAIAAFVSCSKNTEEVVETPMSDKLPINISTTLTRATDSAFEVGDKVGIFVVNQPNALVVSGNHVDNMGFSYSTTWTPDSPIYWLDKTTKADFYCYYPYAESVSTTAHTFATKANQSQLADYKASEFLWGKTAGVTPTEEAVNITTNHTFSNALIILKPGDGFTEATLAAATKSVKICFLYKRAPQGQGCRVCGRFGRWKVDAHQRSLPRNEACGGRDQPQDRARQAHHASGRALPTRRRRIPR